MAGVLGLIIGAGAFMYVGPKLLQAAWTGGPTWVGKTALTWAAIAVGYDMLVNTEQGDAFDTMDVAITGLLTVFLRMGKNAVL